MNVVAAALAPRCWIYCKKTDIITDCVCACLYVWYASASASANTIQRQPKCSFHIGGKMEWMGARERAHSKEKRRFHFIDAIKLRRHDQCYFGIFTSIAGFSLAFFSIAPLDGRKENGRRARKRGTKRFQVLKRSGQPNNRIKRGKMRLPINCNVPTSPTVHTDWVATERLCHFTDITIDQTREYRNISNNL